MGKDTKDKGKQEHKEGGNLVWDNRNERPTVAVESRNDCFLRTWSPLIRQRLLPASDMFNERMWVRFWHEMPVLT